jgi:hypothetical protein
MLLRNEAKYFAGPVIRLPAFAKQLQWKVATESDHRVNLKNMFLLPIEADR